MPPILSRRSATALLVGASFGAAIPSRQGAFAQIGSQKRPAPQHRPLVISQVSVLPMTVNGQVRHDATVVVEHGRISSLDGPGPRGALRINGRGKWLMPGL